VRRRDFLSLAVTAVAVVSIVPEVCAQLDKLANTTPAERAGMQTDFMASKLELTPDQKRAVTDLNLKYANKMEPVIKGSGGPMVKGRQMREINQEKETELRGILSPQQWEKYEASRAEMREKLEERMEKGSRN
jgi:hypothetical protein